jgi:SAM-dependent methyltransferase
LSGMSFLDVGCNEGFFCDFAQRSGASKVVGIDADRRSIDKARALYPACEFLHQTWDTLPAGPWDVILHASALHYATDPYAHIQRLHHALGDDGLLVLEIGVSPHHADMMMAGHFEIGAAFWERVERVTGQVYYPTEMLLRSDLLTDFAVRSIVDSVPQAGDPFPRQVYHCSKFKRIVLMICGVGGAGKSILTSELQKHGLHSTSSDMVLGRILENLGENRAPLWQAAKDELDPARGDIFYRRLDQSSLAQPFVDEIFRMMPKRQRVLVLEGYAFALPRIRELMIARLTERGFRVYKVEV